MAVNTPYFLLHLAVLILSRFCLESTSATTNNITINTFLKDPETIVSENGMYKLGFFSPINSTSRYVGIWYNINESSSETLEVVWVANKNNPIKDTSGVLEISEDLINLQLISEHQNITFWSTYDDQMPENIIPENNTTIAVLYDDGILEVSSEINEQETYTIWNSFYDLTNTLLSDNGPKRLYIDNNNSDFDNEDLILRSWKSGSDPSNGSFVLRIVPDPLPELVTEQYDDHNIGKIRRYWRSGPWNGNQFIGVPNLTTAAGDGLRFMYDETEGTLDFLIMVSNQSSLSTHYVLNYDGNFVRKSWDNDRKEWLTSWKSMVSDCDVYGKCGEFGSCNAKNSPICSCLNGFEPKDKDEWRKGEWRNGCVRKTALRNCSDKAGKEDGFLRVENTKVPDFGELLEVKGKEDDCRIKCLGNCSCLAYAYPKGIGCMVWSSTRSLMDIQEFTSAGADIFIRLAHSDLGEKENHKIIMIVVPIVAATIFLVFVFSIWSWKRRKYSNKEARLKEYQMNEEDLKDLTLFKFKDLEGATNCFSETNQLGRGGFGPVYKGQLTDGQEIAIKRLSSVSSQGLQEFMNEVILISKLQHKNLVKLLGCCVQGEEKLLVYEYMPNKSLDALLFDSSHQKKLNWKKRFEIITGICRGLLYLHRDSRLKIIHRDLKAGNILLDNELNPKISDFGLARIVETKQDEASTLRVVGTYGYMPPEYAMEGRFSEKSDVFSLGVLLLEIVSGKKNTSHLLPESMSLLAYAWKLWTEKNILGLVDESILESSFEGEMMKCIQLGLLCVQEFPEDRPTMTSLFSMLQHNDVTDLPHPTQPAFTHIYRNTSPIDITPSINQCTFTQFSAR